MADGRVLTIDHRNAPFEREGLTFQELMRQPYENMIMSAGLVSGHPVDTIYFRLEREEDWMLLLRRDEALALVWLLSGVCWSEEIGKVGWEPSLSLQEALDKDKERAKQ